MAGYWSPVLQRPVPADSAELVSRACVFACSLSVTSLAKQTEEEKAAKAAAAQEKLLQVFVSEPYLELATGPGRGYAVFHVVEREESVDVLFRRTDWFKVRTEQGVEGWARARDMRRTKLADGIARSSSISATAPASRRTTGKSASVAATTAART